MRTNGFENAIHSTIATLLNIAHALLAFGTDRLVFVSDQFKMSLAQEPSRRDVEYASLGETKLLLDFYAPKPLREDAPLVVWVHGGAWRGGSKKEMPLSKLLENGFAVVSVEYGLSTMAESMVGQASLPATN